SQRMSRLVIELLGLTSLQSGLLSLDFKLHDLGSLLLEQTLAMQPQAHEAGVDLTLTSQAPIALMLADGDRLKQAFANLIDNALKHTPSGGKVLLELTSTPSTVQVLVRDTGQGIPVEELDRVM